MTLSIFIAAIHLLALGIGLGSCFGRAYALRNLKDVSGLKNVFFCDNLFGIAALLWIATGVWRAFGGLEKGTEYYIHSNAFWIKMSLFLLVFIIEITPMITLIRWRIQTRKRLTPDLSTAGKLGAMSYIEAAILISMVFVAVGMARGLWF